MKGYRFVVGKNAGCGMFGYSLTKKEAKAKAKFMIDNNTWCLNNKNKLFLEPVELKKCSVCNALMEESDGVFCLRCDDFYYDAWVDSCEARQEQEVLQ